MRIAYFADANCSHGSQWINHFAEEHHVVLFCLEGQTRWPLLSDKVLKFPILPPRYPLRRPGPFWRCVADLRRIVGEQRIDVVHSMYAVPYAFWAHQLGFPNHVVTTRGSDVLQEYRLQFRSGQGLYDRWTRYMLRRLFERSLQQARVVTSTSGSQQRILREFLDDNSRLHLIRTGVKVAEFDAIYDGLTRRTPTDEIGVLCPRMMKPLYNIDLVVAGFAKLRAALGRRPARLRLIDYGSVVAYGEAIRAQIRALGLEGAVEILPEQGRVGLLQLYKDADVVVMVPRTDGTPVTGIEAMLARRSLLLGSAPYDADIFNPETVHLLPKTSAEAIGDAMLTIVNTPDDLRQARLTPARAAAERGASFRAGVEAVSRLYVDMLPGRPLRECARCVLDTRDDPAMTFDEKGVCSYCHEYDRVSNRQIVFGEAGRRQLEVLVAAIKREGRRKKYDCVVGLSGGVDSTYACYLAVQHGLRPLVVHLDNSWNTELAVQNIENVITRLGLDLYTHVIDWEEFRDLQLAFLKASVVDVELLTDHAIGALLLKTAARYGLRHIVAGTNVTTEAVLPRPWYHLKTDWLNIEDIHRRFGHRRLKTFPSVGYFAALFLTRVRRIRTLPILNYVDYDRARAKSIVTEELGWRDYGGKHHESFFTRFFQDYILPRKFGVDKRKAHLSTLICSGQISREEALLELARAPSQARLERDKDYVLKKLSISNREFEDLMALPVKAHTDYASYRTRHLAYQEKLFRAVRPVRAAFRAARDILRGEPR